KPNESSRQHEGYFFFPLPAIFTGACFAFAGCGLGGGAAGFAALPGGFSVFAGFSAVFSTLAGAACAASMAPPFPLPFFPAAVGVVGAVAGSLFAPFAFFGGGGGGGGGGA